MNVFLSHNSADKPSVEHIKRALENWEPPLSCWFDKDNLRAQGTWLSQIEVAIETCDSAAVFFGRHGMGPVHESERQLLLQRAWNEPEKFRLIPVLLPGAEKADIKGFMSLHNWVDFREGLDSPHSVERLVAFVLGVAPASDGECQLPGEPYRGLESFDTEHSEFYFGREKQVRELCRRIKRWPFVTILGGSGSGKSSLLRCGLNTAVAGEELPELATATRLTFRPGRNPVSALAEVLATMVDRVGESTVADLADEFTKTLSEEPRGLLATMRSRLPLDNLVLICVDQFEEVFTQNTDQQTTEQFVKLLTAVARNHNDRYRIVITLRADFLQESLSLPMLTELIENRTLMLGEMTPDALREVVVRPAQVAGAYLEKGLTERILSDLRDQRGSLPLLQHALAELWSRRRGRWLCNEDYTEIGGVAGALQRRADLTFESLSKREQRIARMIFLRLTTPGDGVPPTRNRVKLSELAPWDENPTFVRAVVDKLRDKEARLLVTHEDGSVEVTHETLIKNWETLGKWLEQSREDIREHKRITRASKEWMSLRDESLLWVAGRLHKALSFSDANPEFINSLEREFLEECKAKLSQSKANSRKSRRTTLALVIGVILLCSLAAVSAGFQWLVARNSLAQSTVNRLLMEARKLEGDERTRLSLATIALRISLENTKPSQLFQAQKRKRGLQVGLTETSADEVWRYLRSRPTFWSRTLRKAVADANLHSSPTCVAFSDVNDFFASGGADGLVYLWKIDELWAGPTILKAHKGPVRTIAFSPKGAYLASGGNDTDIRLWSITEQNLPNQILEGHTDLVTSLAFSPDGEYLASGSVDKTVRLWNMTNPDSAPLVYSRHEDYVLCVAISSDSGLIASGSSDETIHLRRLGVPSTEPRILKGHGGYVSSVAFSRDGRTLASGSKDGNVRLWDVDHQSPTPRLLVGHLQPVRSVAFSPTGHLLATGSDDSTLRLWNLAGSESQPTVLEEPTVTSVAFARDGTTIATGSFTRAVKIWDIGSRQTQAKVLTGAPSSCIAYSPKLSRLVAASKTNAAYWTRKDSKPTIVDATRDTSSSSERVIGVALSQNGRYLVRSYESHIDIPTASDSFPRSSQRRLLIWDLEQLGTPRTLDGLARQQGRPDVLAFSIDGRYLAQAGDDKIRVWDLTRPQVASYDLESESAPQVSERGESILSLTFSNDAMRVAAGSADNFVRVWSLGSPTTSPQIFKGHGQFVGTIAFSNDGELLASGSADGTVRVWITDVPEKLPLVLKTPDARVNTVLFSPEDEWIAAGASDGTVRLWNVDELEAAPRLLKGASEVRAIVSLAFSPDGQELACGSSAGVIRIWRQDESWNLPVDFSALLTFAEEAADRTFTSEEIKHFGLEDVRDLVPLDTLLDHH